MAGLANPLETTRMMGACSSPMGGVEPDDWLTDVWFFRMDAPS